MKYFFNSSKVNKLFLFSLTFYLVLFLIGGSVLGSSFAAGPGTIEFENLLKNGYAESEIFVNNPEDVPVDVEIVAGDTISEWVYFYPPSLVLEPHESRKILAIIQPPADTANGQYKGTVTLVSKPQYNRTMDTQYGLNIEAAVILKINAEIIGEQIVDYSILDVSLESVEIGFPVPLTVSGKNNGNVRVMPRLVLDIYNSDRSVLILSKNMTLESILPTVTKIETIDIPTESLSIGQYWVNISVLVFDETVHTKLITFDILEKGALRLSGDLVQVITNKQWALPGDIVRLDAIFVNTGQMSTNAKFKGEVYLEDKLVDTIESDELSASVGSIINLTMYYVPEKVGIYKVEGIVYYSGKSTYKKGTVLNVFSDKQNNSFFVEYKYLIMIASVLLLVFVLKGISGDFYSKSGNGMDAISQKYQNIDTSLDNAVRKSERLKRKIRHIKYRS